MLDRNAWCVYRDTTEIRNIAPRVALASFVILCDYKNLYSRIALSNMEMALTYRCSHEFDWLTQYREEFCGNLRKCLLSHVLLLTRKYFQQADPIRNYRRGNLVFRVDQGKDSHPWDCHAKSCCDCSRKRVHRYLLASHHGVALQYLSCQISLAVVSLGLRIMNEFILVEG